MGYLMPDSRKEFTCPKCKKLLEISVFANRKLCDDCNKELRRSRNKKYDSNRTRSKIAKVKREQEIRCINCEKNFKPKEVGTLPKYCDECRQQYVSIYERKVRGKRKKEPKEAKAHSLKYRFGISVEEYEERFRLQNGLCASCGSPPSNGKILYIDHDHSCCPGDKSCGKCIRELLCQRCNSALGFANDNSEILLAMLAYLKNGGFEGFKNVIRLRSGIHNGD